MSILEKFAFVYIIILSIIGFIFMFVDKRKAKKGAWRISERTLLLIAICGGGIGSFAGMQMFRHKTQKTKFKIILPLFGILYAIVCLYLLNVIDHIL